MGKTSYLKYYGLGRIIITKYELSNKEKRKNSILKMNIYGILASDLGY